MSAVNKSGKLNVNLYSFVPFVGGFSSVRFRNSDNTQGWGRNARMPDPQLIIAVGFAIFNVYLFAFSNALRLRVRQRGKNSPIVCLISCWTRPLHGVLGGGGGSAACWFIVCRMILHLNCLQNVWQGSNTTFEWGFLMSWHACVWEGAGF